MIFMSQEYIYNQVTPNVSLGHTDHDRAVMPLQVKSAALDRLAAALRQPPPHGGASPGD